MLVLIVFYGLAFAFLPAFSQGAWLVVHFRARASYGV